MNVLPEMRPTLLLASALLGLQAPAQFDLQWDPSVPIQRQGADLELAWAGGLNFCQVSEIDLDQDGVKDLFLFDRSGDRVVTLLNGGTPGQVDYTHTIAYNEVWPFPELHDWVLLRDYNCDGKEDIFSYSLGGFAVYRNISDNNGLAFELVDTLVRSNYVPTNANLFVTQVDVPGIADIDGDGDLDVLTFSIFGAYVEYHKNLSMELYGTCDSLEFEVFNRCWGYFSENLNNNSVTLNNPCNYNVPDPEIGGAIEALTLELQREGQHPLSADGTEKSAAHVGSTVTPLDLNGDGVKDLLLGDVSYTNLTALTNGGTVTDGLMVDQDTLFPVYDQPVQLPIFPGAYYVDVNNDAKRDLLVSPNGTSLCQNFQSLWYYLNTGTDDTPVFSFQQEDLFQDAMIDVGECAYPVPFDHNGDGLMDLVVADFGYFQQGGNYPSKFMLLENTGTATDPAFTVVTDDYEDLSTSGIGQAMYPAFGDLDGDGDQDMYIGDLQGRLHYYENISTTPVAEFQLAMPNVSDSGGNTIDVGQFATPQFFDVNGDGLLDMLVGERNGNVNYFRNTGSALAPEWAYADDTLGNLVVTEYWNITGYAVPFMFLNGNGEREMLVGSESGYIHHWTDIEGNLNGTFTLADSMFAGIKEGIRSGVAVQDLTGDGYPEVLTGNYRGGIGFWRNDFGVGIATLDADRSLRLFPNPANEATEIVLDRPAPTGTFLQVFSAHGQLMAELPVRGQRVRVTTAEWANGLYLFRLTGGATGTARLLVAR